MTWRVSPAATDLEQLVLQWLAEMLRLPAGFDGGVYDTASVGTMPRSLLRGSAPWNGAKRRLRRTRSAIARGDVRKRA